MVVKCKSIEQSASVQRALEARGYTLINPARSLEADSFVVVFPPCWCRNDFENVLLREQYGGCPIHTFDERPCICSKSDDNTDPETPLHKFLAFHAMIEVIQSTK